MANFCNEMKRDLIKLVYGQRDLWDPTSPNVRSNNIREKIWQGIGKQLKKNNEVCKGEWVKLRKSYNRYKKSVVTSRRSSQNDFFKLMTFLDVRKQQGNTNQLQINVNRLQNNVNQQQSNVNQQQRNETQQTGNGNQPKGIENNFHSRNNSGTQNLRPEATGQKYVPSLHVNVNVASNTHEGPQPFCKNTPVARPKPKVAQKQRPQGKRTNNIKKNTVNKKKKTCARPKIRSSNTVGDELDSFCKQIRSTLGRLPRDLQIKAQDELFQVLSRSKKEALASKRPTSNATATDTFSLTLRQGLTASANGVSVAEQRPSTSFYNEFDDRLR